MIEAAADGVRQQLAAERANEVLLVADHELPETRHTLESRAVGKRRRRVDRRVVADRPPFAERVEVLEREAERIHPLMTRRARRVLPMQFHALAERARLALGARL